MRQGRKDQIPRHHGRQVHPNASGQLCFVLAKQALQFLHVRKQVLAAFIQHTAVLGRLHLARGALQQARAEQFFQCLHMLGHRGTRQAQALAGAGETRQFGDAHEGAQQLQFVHGIVRLFRPVISLYRCLSRYRRTNTLIPTITSEDCTMTRKIALITGASRGLGRSAALRLAAQGVDIIGTYHSQADEAQAVVEQIEQWGGRAAMLKLDVSQSATFDAFVEAVGGVLKRVFARDDFDFLINNAGIGIHASFAETSEAQFDQLVAIQFKGPFFLTQKLLPLIRDGGRILNISSGLARFSLPGYAAYAAMKGAMEVLTRYQAKELGARGISVNILAPGAIETDFGGGAVRDNANLNAMVANNTALGRAGLPDDIGGAIASLLADGSHWITGQRIEASGGMFL